MNFIEKELKLTIDRALEEQRKGLNYLIDKAKRIKNNY